MNETHKEIETLIGEAIGEASMCWSETPQGIFDSTRAREICDRLTEAVKRRHHLETLIRGHMEAMRPLLDEWCGKL
jgi:hypothetical protein